MPGFSKLGPDALRRVTPAQRSVHKVSPWIARELRSGNLKPTLGKARLLETHREVIAGWHAAADALLEARQGALAEKIWGFIGAMSPPRTTDEQLAAEHEERTRTRERERQEERTR